MTRRTNARIAGIAFLAYIALGIAAMLLLGRATNAVGIEAKLALIAQHATDVRIAVLLQMFTGFCALALGVSLYAITRDEDHDLAMLALTFRVGEGVVGVIAAQKWLSILWLATVSGAHAPDARSVQGLGAFLLYGQGSGAMFFAVATVLFSWLLLRGRIVPIPLGWLGVIASILWFLTTPLQITGAVRGSIIQIITWTPMAVFEIWLALWLTIKGAAMPVRRQPA